MSRETAKPYGPVAIGFHWAIAVLFLCQIALGFSMERVKSMALQFELIQWHKSFGFVILGLAATRLLWRAAAGPVPAAPGLSTLERLAAAIVQGALLVLTVAVPLAGWALASTSTLGIPSFVFDLVVVPHLPLTPSAAAEAFWREAHGFLAYTTLLLVAGHVAAALRHHFLLRDDVLARMLPGLSSGNAEPAEALHIRRTKDDA
jgi:cytochrome b561